MNQSHPSIEKLLERALEHLIEINLEDGATVDFNGNIYKQINFSAQQVIDCMHELAIPGDVLLTSRSSFRKDKEGKPNRYMQMVERAKIKRIARQSKAIGLSVSLSQQLNMAQLQMDNIALRKENNMLRGSVAALESFISQAELKAAMEDTRPMIGKTVDRNEHKYLVILRDLLSQLFDQGMLVVTPRKGKVPASIYLDMVEGTVKLCNLEDVEEFVDFKTDTKDQITLR